MPGHVGALIASVSTLAAMEATWLLSAKPFYVSMLSAVSSDGALRIRSIPAAGLAYAAVLAGAWVLVLRPAAAAASAASAASASASAGRAGRAGRTLNAAWKGAVFGATVYGVYNLTNMATLPGYRWLMVAVDTMWGTTLFAVFAAVFAAVLAGRPGSP